MKRILIVSLIGVSLLPAGTVTVTGAAAVAGLANALLKVDQSIRVIKSLPHKAKKVIAKKTKATNVVK